MKKVAMLLLAMMTVSFIPCGAAPKTVEKEYTISFDGADAGVQMFEGEKIDTQDSYDGKCLCISDTQAKLSFLKSSSELRISQTVNAASDGESNIRIKADDTDIIRVNFTDSYISVLSKKGWTKILKRTKGVWYKISISADLKTSTFSVFVDDMKLGTDFEMLRNVGYANNLVYDTKSRFLADDILIKTTGVKRGAQSGAASDMGSPYPTMKPYPHYDVPEQGIADKGLSGEEPLAASSQAEGFPAENVLKQDKSVWKSDTVKAPDDKGKSLYLSKPEEGGGTSLMSYSFAPVSGKLTLEQDFLACEDNGQKAMPYFIDSGGANVLSVLLNDKNLATNTGIVIIENFLTDTWYSVRYELDIYSQTADVYVNGAPAAKGIPFRARAEDIAKIQWHMGGDQKGEMYIDNIKLYTSTALGNKRVLLEDDFEGYPDGRESLDGWKLAKANGEACVSPYRLVEKSRYPQYIYVDMTREGRLEQTEITFPENTRYKFDVSVSRNGSYFVKVAKHTEEFCSGTVHDAFGPVGARWVRFTLYEGIDDNGNDVAAQIQNINAWWWKKNPVENAAFTAKVETSSSNTSIYDGRGINDNIVAEFGNIGEWQSAGETNPSVTLSWDTPQKVDRIILYDRANLDANIKSGTLKFDDGTQIEVTDIPATGYPKTVDFKAKSVKSVTFTANETEGENAGLSEIQVFKAGTNPELAEYVEPWKRVSVNTDYGGHWIVSGDIDNDGEAEIVSAQVVDYSAGLGRAGAGWYDRHEVVSAVAQDLNGEVLWTWGTPKKGIVTPGSDVPCIIYDIDNDGNKEVLLCTRDSLIFLNAKTGEEIKRYALPVSEEFPEDWASDCINIANISGKDYPSDIIIKSRYTDIWAFTSDWELIWKHTGKIQNYRTAHQPWIIDIDNDGKDEVLTNYSLIDDDGTIKWSLDKKKFKANIAIGHQDSIKAIVFNLIGDVNADEVINQKDLDMLRSALKGETELNSTQTANADTDGDGVLTEKDAELLRQRVNHEINSFPNKGLAPEDIRLCLCFCGGYEAAMIDGNGEPVWAAEDGLHHETIIPGNVLPENEGIEIVTNPTFMEIDTSGNCGVFIFDTDGNVLGERYGFHFNRYTQVFNWTGTDEDYIMMPTDNMAMDGHYNLKVKPLAPWRAFSASMGTNMPVGDTRYAGDLDGDGTTDMTLIIDVPDGGVDLYIYQNKNGKKIADALGTGPNFSHY